MNFPFICSNIHVAPAYGVYLTNISIPNSTLFITNSKNALRVFWNIYDFIHVQIIPVILTCFLFNLCHLICRLIIRNVIIFTSMDTEIIPKRGSRYELVWLTTIFHITIKCINVDYRTIAGALTIPRCTEYISSVTGHSESTSYESSNAVDAYVWCLSSY